MDILIIFGFVVGFGAILGGQFLEGGHIGSLINGPACLIVIGGTVGAVMLQTPYSIFMSSIRMMFWTIFPPKLRSEEAIQKIMEWSNIARKEGLLGLEDVAENEADNFAQKGVQVLVEGREGARLIKQGGSQIWAQDEASCVVYGMPADIVDAGLADHVLSLDDVGKTLAANI